LISIASDLGHELDEVVYRPYDVGAVYHHLLYHEAG